MYRNDVGHEMELLCHQAPVWGQGNVSEGVAVVNRTDSDKFDEAAYITLPPCLRGPGLGGKGTKQVCYPPGHHHAGETSGDDPRRPGSPVATT